MTFDQVLQSALAHLLCTGRFGESDRRFLPRPKGNRRAFLSREQLSEYGEYEVVMDMQPSALQATEMERDMILQCSNGLPVTANTYGRRTTDSDKQT